MKKFKRGNLVNHELSRALLDYKWYIVSLIFYHPSYACFIILIKFTFSCPFYRRKFGAYVFFINLIIYIAYLSLLTYYTVDIRATAKNNTYSSAFSPPAPLVSAIDSTTTLPTLLINSTITTERRPPV